jgi:predicted GNAT family acetyltransferase
VAPAVARGTIDRVAITVADAPHEHRYEIRVDGELAGFTKYFRREGVVTFTHTEIEPEYEGQGLGSQLVSQALDDVRANGGTVVAQCPFVKAFIHRHPDEYGDLVSDAST